MAIMTVISAAVVPPFIPILLKYSAVDGTTACGLTNESTFYISGEFDFSTAPAIWLNVGGTGVPVAGFYSDGIISREWNGADTLAQPTSCSATLIELTFGIDTSGTFCSSATSTFYIAAGESFITANEIFTDVNLTPASLADPGWYSDGLTVREWFGASFDAPVYKCPTESLNLGANGTDACMGSSGTGEFMFLEGQTFATAMSMYTITGVLAAASWYAEDFAGGAVRQWDGISFINSSTC